MKKYPTLAEYLKEVPPKQRAVLNHMRRIIKTLVPGADEGVTYGLYYTISGRGFVTAVGYRKSHKDLSLYATPQLVKLYAKDLKPWSVTTGTVHFKHDRPLPDTLIRTIVRARLKLLPAGKKVS